MKELRKFVGEISKHTYDGADGVSIYVVVYARDVSEAEAKVMTYSIGWALGWALILTEVQ